MNITTENLSKKTKAELIDMISKAQQNYDLELTSIKKASLKIEQEKNELLSTVEHLKQQIEQHLTTNKALASLNKDYLMTISEDSEEYSKCDSWRIFWKCFTILFGLSFFILATLYMIR